MRKSNNILIANGWSNYFIDLPKMLWLHQLIHHMSLNKWICILKKLPLQHFCFKKNDWEQCIKFHQQTKLQIALELTIFQIKLKFKIIEHLIASPWNY